MDTPANGIVTKTAKWFRIKLLQQLETSLIIAITCCDDDR